MSTETDKAIDEFVEKLKEIGVSHYVVAACDPDSNTDWVQVGGSGHWRAGVGMSLMDDAREELKGEKEER